MILEMSSTALATDPASRAPREPVFAERAGRLDTVILSAERRQAQQARHDRARRAARKKAFESEFGDWIAAENARVERQAIPGEDLRPW